MDIERLRNATLAWSRNQRLARRAKGLPLLRPGYDNLEAPDTDSMEGVDATKDEIIAYLLWDRQQKSGLMGTYQRASVAGMAVGMGGHELNSEMSNVLWTLRELDKKLKDDGDWPARIEYARGSVRRLGSSIDYRSRFSKGNGGQGVTGKDVAEAVAHLLGRGLASDQVRVEATEAFLAARLSGSFDGVVPVYVNLVRNAWRWTRDAGRERVIRLDAYTVEHPPEDPTVDPNDEEEGYKAIPTYDTVGVVEDSGVGIPKGMEETIFQPFKTSGFGGTGLGLYICRRNLEDWGCTTVVDPKGSDLGGARFLVGRTKVLDAVPRAAVDETDRLALEAVAIAQLHLDGRSDHIPRLHGDTYADIMRETLRIRLEGPGDASERRLLAAADAMQGILDGRLDATALEPFEEDLLPAPGGMGI